MPVSRAFPLMSVLPRHTVLPTAILLLLAGGAAAQEPTPESQSLREQPRAFGEVRVGLFFVKPTLLIGNVGVDTNVRNDRTQPVQDFVSGLQPGIQFGFKSAQTSVVADTRANLVYFRRTRDDRSVNPAGTVSVERRFGRSLAVYSTSGLGWSTDRTLEVDARLLTRSKSATAGVRLGARKLRADINASYDETLYDESAHYLGIRLSETLNRITKTAGVRLSHYLTPYTALTLDTRIAADRFPGGRVRDTDAGQVLAGIETSPRALIAGSAQIGYRLARPLNDRTPAFSGPVGRVGLSTTWRDMLSLGVGAERDFEYSYHPDRFYFVYDLYEASVRQALWRRFDVGARASYTTMRHRAFVAPDAVDPAFREYLIETGGSVGLRVTRGSRIGVFVQQWERRSGGRPYKSQRVGLELTLGKLTATERGVTVHGLGR
jgi:hypothetical protein